MEKRFTVKLADNKLVATMKAAADELRVPIVQWVTEAIQQKLTAAPGQDSLSRYLEEVREKNRELYRAKRARAGKPVRAPRAVPFRKSGVLAERTCPLCDAVFTPDIRKQHQKYCHKLHTRYAFTYNHDMTIARPAYAAFMVRKAGGSKR